MRLLLAAALIVLGGCATAVQVPADETARLDPVQFFSGRSQGEGSLTQMFSPPRRLTVRSDGRPDGRNGLILTQVILQEGKPPRARTWMIRPSGPGRYTGSLTEASGPVLIRIAGPRAEINYVMNGGIRVRQQLALQPDGRTVLNRMTFNKWGVRVASLEETIRRLP